MRVRPLSITEEIPLFLRTYCSDRGLRDLSWVPEPFVSVRHDRDHDHHYQNGNRYSADHNDGRDGGAVRHVTCGAGASPVLVDAAQQICV